MLSESEWWFLNQRNWKAHLAFAICMATHRALFTISSCPWFHTHTKGQRAQRPSLSYSDTSLSSCLSADLLIFQSCACVCLWVFAFFPSAVMQHAEEQRLSQTITPCDGSVLLHNEMKLKCLIDFSFTFLTIGGTLVYGHRASGLIVHSGPVSYLRHAFEQCPYCSSMFASII